MKESIIDELKKYEEDIISWRRNLHSIPELGNELPLTVSYVKGELDKLGIEYHTLVNGNAIVGLIDSGKEGKTIALRADMDGLPVIEETNLPFASKNGNMHACGHDGHTAMLLGAAKFLNSNKHLFKGKVKLLFQPGEESPGGAQPMILEGALKNPDVDAVLGMHNGHINDDLLHGEVGISYGPIMASVDTFIIDIIGKGSHGAYPEQGHDPIIAACETVNAIQTIKSRNIKATETALISVCQITGGTTSNIIPDKVHLEGTVRTFNKEVQNLIEERLKEIVNYIPLAHGAKGVLNYIRKYPATINDENFSKNFEKTARKVLGDDKVKILSTPVMGAEDMSFFLEEVPGTYFFFTDPNPVDGSVWPHHNPKFDLDETLLSQGSALLSQGAIDYLNEKYD